LWTFWNSPCRPRCVVSERVSERTQQTNGGKRVCPRIFSFQPSFGRPQATSNYLAEWKEKDIEYAIL
jgi:hypothetical protein